jgi:hypothetical protein
MRLCPAILGGIAGQRHLTHLNTTPRGSLNMSSIEKQPTDVTTMENHAPVPPALTETTTKKDAQPSAPSADEKITTFENHAPVPPALDLNGK